MELRVLRYFLTIAEEENITRAADILHITQPTLSRQIMQLEEELGTQLFVRGRHSIKLTDEGLYLRRRAEEILSIADSTERAIRHRDDKDIIGEISIGCTETHSMEELASMMQRFRSLHPLVDYSMYTMNADSIREGIDKGVIDLGLMTEPVDTSRFDTLHLRDKESWGAIMRKDSDLAEKSAVTPEDLSPCSLMIPQRNEVICTLESWFGKSFHSLDIPVRYNLGRNVALLVQYGIGIGIGFDLFSEYADLKFIPLDPPLITGSVICWKKNQVFSRVTGSFIEFLKYELR